MRKNWLCFFVGVLEFCLIGMLPAQTRKPLTVEEIYTKLNREIYASYPSALHWLPHSDRFSYIQRENHQSELRVYDVRSGKEKAVLSSADLQFITTEQETLQINMYNYQWLPDETGLIFTSHRDIWLFDLRARKLKRLTESDDLEEEVLISPDGQYVSYVKNYNLYALDLKTGQEIQLTQDGSEDQFYGKLDWVYQEELVGRGFFRAYWWSPDSRHIAFLKFDERRVPQYPLVDWMSYHPHLEMMRYPKAGDPNPVVRLGVVSLPKPTITWIQTGDNTDIYIPRVYWLPDGKQVAFIRLDRHQQHLEFLFADVATGSSHTVLEENDDAFLNVGSFVYFFKKKPYFLWGSERSGFNHLYLYDYQGRLIRQLTDGDWMVTQLAGVDKKEKWVYFTATRKDIRERHLYRITVSGKGMKRLTVKEGVHRSRLSNSGKYFLDTYSHVFTPYEVNLWRASGKKLRTIASCPIRLEEEYQVRAPEFITFTGEKTGLTYYAQILKPVDFDPRKKYPALIYVYGGPHAQVVLKAYGGTRALWHQMLAQRGFIIFSMDNRGSWGRGHNWEKVIYRHMGKYELMDQLEGVRYLKSLPYVDASRIGIWGWSYGGYMTLYALTHSREFRTGISVAPVTDWRDYDTIYTERYMSLPQDNPDGYRDSSPVFFADSLSGHLLLVHGTGDDNVHFQNTVQMVDRLVDAGKYFQLLIYPQQAHGIGATTDRIHLFNNMTRFLERFLKGSEN